jgi:hypothetical protein
MVDVYASVDIKTIFDQHNVPANVGIHKSWDIGAIGPDLGAESRKEQPIGYICGASIEVL